ncbi:Uncharacterized conserved protein, DUF983 family [Chelatococcus sambhunathii]|uniref:Uncharacterized conserved protein, DUF983 family n=1 Tax=Chelatococcus sambhunathii TaxID=363953 RepID=A0ABM9U8A2_9HYPH|nr:DUF983 domain-containing protein [Chelatococcus sambhunathii]CUA89302.1 Uncharacterized conserved protein, DUF983 family [Chelatococcus sambhunathii]
MAPTGRLMNAFEERRDWQGAIKRGLACRCPACGRGRLFSGFLKVRPQCEACGEDLSHHRSDDLPPYIVITIVGHVVVGANLTIESAAEWPLWTHMVLWPLLALGLCLALLQPVKGGVVGYQWALRMHGFGDNADEEAPLRMSGHEG